MRTGRRKRLLGGLLALAGLALAGLALAACAPQAPLPGVKARPGAVRPPYHQPAAWWSDRHALLLERATAGLTLADCRLCHQPSQACRPCHAYLGLPPGEADRD